MANSSTSSTTTTIAMRSFPSPVKSELDHHRKERCNLSAQGKDQSNEDPGPTSTALALRDQDVDDMIRSFDETEIALLKQYIDFLGARLAYAESQNASLVEENRRLQELLLHVSSSQSHSDEQDWAYITNGPSSPYIRSGSPSSSGGGFEGLPFGDGP